MDPLEHARILAVGAYVLLAISVLSGEILSGRLAPPTMRRRLFSIHRAASVAGLVLVLVHGLDAAHLGTRPQMMLGMAALATMAVPAIAWAARRRLISAWRGVHHAAYLAFLLATIHAVAFHSGEMPPFEMALYGASVGGVIGLAIVRLVKDRGLATAQS